MVRHISIRTLSMTGLLTGLLTAGVLTSATAQQPQRIPPPLPAAAQPGDMSSTIRVDALAFRGSLFDDKARVDVYLAVPYQSMEFQEYNKMFAAQYRVTMAVRDTVGRKLLDTTFTRQVAEADYGTSRGKTGKADIVQRSFTLRPGTYRIEVTVADQFSRRDYTQTKTLTVSDFNDDLPALSSILYVSEIEQRGSRYSITPFIGDAIWNLESPLFIFFETYAERVPQQVGFSWKIAQKDGRILSSGVSGSAETLKEKTQQHFMRLTYPQRPTAGTYSLVVRMHPYTTVLDTNETLSMTARPFVIPRTATTAILSDLNRAIRQLRYVVPSQSDIDQILGAPTEADRQAQFEDFWKKLDPTPNTTRNEAFEDYYARIEYANKVYKSYNEGWLTDMGMIYIIYGEPMNIERYTSQTGSALLVRWTYPNSQTFTFEDNTGFGDYRLRSSLPPGARYQYKR